MWEGENLKVALMSRCFDLLHRAVLGSFNRLPLLCLSKHPSPAFPQLHPPKIILVMGTLLTMAVLSPFRLHTFSPFSHPSIISFEHFRYLSIFCFAPFSHFSRTVYKFVCCLFTDISKNLPTSHLLHISKIVKILLHPFFSPECVQPCGARMQERSRWSSHFPQQVDDVPQDQAQLLRPWQLPLLLRRSPVHEQHRGHQGGRHGLWDLQHS